MFRKTSTTSFDVTTATHYKFFTKPIQMRVLKNTKYEEKKSCDELINRTLPHFFDQPASCVGHKHLHDSFKHKILSKETPSYDTVWNPSPLTNENIKKKKNNQKNNKEEYYANPYESHERTR